MKRTVFGTANFRAKVHRAILVGALSLTTSSSLLAATIAGWDFNSLPGGNANFGPSPYAATAADPNVISGGLTRGAGVSTAGTAAQRAWGGSGWDGNADAAAAIAAGDFVTFTLQPADGKTLSFSSLDPIQYRRSGTGPASGLLQYSTGGSFTNIASLDYSSTSSSGASLSAINLSGIAALQNIQPSTQITFRIANWGASSSAGTWYLFDVGTDAGVHDFVVNGTTGVAVPEPATIALVGLCGIASCVANRRRRNG
ncbi:MAG: PEP-CTERM sorting domain-containing protein [Pirellulales bacterium]